MRVLLVTKPLSPPWNDSAKMLPRDLARAAGDRHELHVLVGRDAPGSWPQRVRVHGHYPRARSYRPSPGQQLRLLAALWRMRREVDALHFFFQPHPAAVRAARTIRWLTGLPAIHTVLAAPAEAHGSELRFADQTVTLSRHTAARLGGEGEGLTVIPPALGDLEPLPREPVDRVRAELGLERPYHLYPGDWEFSGGHELLLEIWARDPGLPTLVLAGRPKTARAEGARLRLQALADRRNLGDRVRWLGETAELRALIAGAGAVLFPARSLYAKTDLPMVILEAWREGRPVLASDLAQLVEALDGVTPTLTPTVEAWGEALRRLPAEGETWGRRGRERLRERHDAERMARAYRAIYDRIERERVLARSR